MNGIAPLPDATLPLAPLNPTIQKEYMCPDDMKDGGVRLSNKTGPGQGALTFGIVNNQATVRIGQNTGGYWSYSVNAVLNPLGRVRNNFPKGTQPWADPLKYVNIKNPTNFFMFIEEGDDSLFNDEVFDPPAYNGGDKLTRRHAGGGNVGFGDGHVEWFSETQFDLGGGNSSGGPVDNWTAMQAPFTRYFFPDWGDFAAPSK